jgi:hypothetical protein
MGECARFRAESNFLSAAVNRYFNRFFGNIVKNGTFAVTNVND